MPDPVAKAHDSHGVSQPDLLIAALADRQHGLITRSQLRDLGLGRGAIEHRIRNRRLREIQPKVYAFGHRKLSQHGIWMAAVLAAGPSGVLSHWSAANLQKLRAGKGPLSHVTIPSRRSHRPGIRFHYADLPTDETTRHNGIPVTAHARTMLDLAPSLTIPSLTRMLERAESSRTWTGPSIQEILERYPIRAGAPKLRALIAKPRAMTRSELETRFLHLVDEWGLPRPQMNISIEGYEVDCVWPEARLIVELDVYATHGSPQAFEIDRLRDRTLQLAGWTVLRVTDVQLTGDPLAVRRDLKRRLA